MLGISYLQKNLYMNIYESKKLQVDEFKKAVESLPHLNEVESAEMVTFWATANNPTNFVLSSAEAKTLRLLLPFVSELPREVKAQMAKSLICS